MGLGMPEVVLILVIALIVFGPRKLPELGKSLGQAMAQFRRASDDFKRTWEQEVEMEKYKSSGDNYTDPSTDYQASSDQYGSEYYAPDYNGSESEKAETSAPGSDDGQTAESQPEPVVAETASAAAPEKKHWI